LNIHFNIILPFFKSGASWWRMINVMHRPFYPRKRDPLPIIQETGWPTGPVGMTR
jgi:hypothetical protein